MFGMKVFKTSLKLLVWLEIFFHCSILTWLIDVRKVFFLVQSQHEHLDKMVFLRVLFLVVFFSFNL